MVPTSSSFNITSLSPVLTPMGGGLCEMVSCLIWALGMSCQMVMSYKDCGYVVSYIRTVGTLCLIRTVGMSSLI